MLYLPVLPATYYLLPATCYLLPPSSFECNGILHNHTTNEVLITSRVDCIHVGLHIVQERWSFEIQCHCVMDSAGDNNSTWDLICWDFWHTFEKMNSLDEVYTAPWVLRMGTNSNTYWKRYYICTKAVLAQLLAKIPEKAVRRRERNLFDQIDTRGPGPCTTTIHERKKKIFWDRSN